MSVEHIRDRRPAAVVDAWKVIDELASDPAIMDMALPDAIRAVARAGNHRCEQSPSLPANSPNPDLIRAIIAEQFGSDSANAVRVQCVVDKVLALARPTYLEYPYSRDPYVAMCEAIAALPASNLSAACAAAAQSLDAETPATDTDLLDWLEREAQASPTGVSIDYARYVEGGQVLEKGYRFMRQHYLGPRADTVRQAIELVRQDRSGS